MNQLISRRKSAALETRQLILNAAKKIYSIEANANAPISHVARKAGVAEGTVFSHFPDKPSLLAATLQDEIEHTLAGAWITLQQDSPCIEQFLHLAGSMYTFYAERPPLFRMLLKESLFLRGEWGKRIMDYTLHFVGQVAKLIEQAKSRGEYRPDAESLVVARSFFGLYFIELIGALSQDAFDADQTLAMLRAALVQMEKGLLAR